MLVLGACSAAVLAVSVAMGDRCGGGPSIGDRGGPEPPDPGAREPEWPSPLVQLAPLTVPRHEGQRPLRIYLDAGHGAQGNTGNVSAECEPEQEFTLRLTSELVERLGALEAFDATASRWAGQLVAYADRISHAQAWEADLFVSLHSDVRGSWVGPSGDARAGCPNVLEEPGFAVLWSDEGDDDLVAARLAFARNLAWRLVQIGLPAYDGVGYQAMYRPDSEQPGVFVDRHAPGKRIYVLRAPQIPSVILETHNAWHPGEVTRWNEPATVEALATAIMSAAVDTLRGNAPPAGA